MIRLKSPEFIDPMWFNKYKYGKHFAVVSENKIIKLDGVDLIIESDEINYAVGTKVVVWLDRYFYFTTKEEEEKLERKRKLEIESDINRRVELSVKNRLEAEEFNSKYSIPVKWTIHIKPVLSGLAEKSLGDGSKKNSVNHILLLEDLLYGKLVRERGSFLCSTGKYNGILSDLVGIVPHYMSDLMGNKYIPKITCKSCLKLAERWRVS